MSYKWIWIVRRGECQDLFCIVLQKNFPKEKGENFRSPPFPTTPPKLSSIRKSFCSFGSNRVYRRLHHFWQSIHGSPYLE